MPPRLVIRLPPDLGCRCSGGFRTCSTVTRHYTQWRSQGAVAAVAPLGLDSDKTLLLYQYFHTTSQIHNHVFLCTRSVLWPRIYRKCICGRGFAPRTILGSSRRSPDPVVGWEGNTLPGLHPTRRRRLDPRAAGARVCSLHIISGYAIECTCTCTWLAGRRADKSLSLRRLTLSPPIPLRLYTLPCWSNPERQSARMSKIKNTALDQYGAESFEQQQFGTAGVEGVNESSACGFRLAAALIGETYPICEEHHTMHYGSV